jgi:hypothetical protein
MILRAEGDRVAIVASLDDMQRLVLQEISSKPRHRVATVMTPSSTTASAAARSIRCIRSDDRACAGARVPVGWKVRPERSDTHQLRVGEDDGFREGLAGKTTGKEVICLVLPRRCAFPRTGAQSRRDISA